MIFPAFFGSIRENSAHKLHSICTKNIICFAWVHTGWVSVLDFVGLLDNSIECIIRSTTTTVNKS